MTALPITPTRRTRTLLCGLAACFGVSLLGLPAATAQIIPSAGLHGYLTDRIDLAETGGQELELYGRSGWHAGLDFRLGKKALYAQPGVHYYKTNTEVSNLREVGVPTQLLNQRHTAVKVPLMAGLRLGRNGTAAVHLHGGPVATFALSDRLAYDLGGQRELTVGAQAGVAVDLLRVNVYARYEWGLTPAFNDAAATADVLTVGVGLVL